MTDQPLVGLLAAALITFVGAFLAEPILLALARIFGLYAVVKERTCRVYMLFGKVIGVLDEPGLHFLPAKLGPAAFGINLLGNCYVLDMRLDQEYLRSQPVNSEEGAPMGIGIWYEMWISDPVSYLFKNTDPRGSLRANVSNATVRCLSNMKLAEMMETRHNMSQTVRAEVTDKSQAWGYQLGSVYIRKVHFRDVGMIHQIEEKVATLGQAFQEIAREPEVATALFDVLETQRILASSAKIAMLPGGPHGRMLANLMAADKQG